MKGLLGLRWTVGKASGGTENVDDDVCKEKVRGAALPQVNDNDDKKQNISHKNTGRKRRQSDIHPITFYAIRPGSNIEEPVIFFGVKEFDLFVQTAKEKFSVGDKEATSVNAKSFQKLADALAFVNFQDGTPEDAEILQASKRRKEQVPANNTTLKPPPPPPADSTITTTEIATTKPAPATGNNTTKSSKFKVQWTVVSQEASKPRPQGGKFGANPAPATDVTPGAPTIMVQLGAPTSTTTTMAEARQTATASLHVKDQPGDSSNNDNQSEQGLKLASVSAGRNNDEPLFENWYDECDDDASHGFVMASPSQADDDDDDSRSHIDEEPHEFSMMTHIDNQATTANEGDTGLARNSVGKLADEPNRSHKENVTTLSSTTTLMDAPIDAEKELQADDSFDTSTSIAPAGRQPAEDEKTEEPSPLVTTHRIETTRNTSKSRTTWTRHSTKKAPSAKTAENSLLEGAAARKMPPKEPAIQPHMQNNGPSNTVLTNSTPTTGLSMNTTSPRFPNWRPNNFPNNMNYFQADTMTAAAAASQGLRPMLAATPQTWRMNMMGGGMPPQLWMGNPNAASLMFRQAAALGGVHPNSNPLGQVGIHPNNPQAGQVMQHVQQNNMNGAVRNTATNTANTSPTDEGIADGINPSSATVRQQQQPAMRRPADQTTCERTETHDTVERERKVSVRQQAKQRWNEKITLLQEYKKEHGDFTRIIYHGSIEEKYKPLIAISRNLRKRLRAYQKDPTQKRLGLTAEKRQQLIDLGFSASTGEKRFYDGQWENYFDLLKQYKEEYGDCNVGAHPNQDEKYNALLDWVNAQQRAKSQQCKMASERRQRLLDLGFSFTFNLKSSLHWEERFELLKEYKEEYGGCNVPGNNPDLKDKYKPLFGWLTIQRSILRAEKAGTGESINRKAYKMTKEQEKRLLDLGVIVDPPRKVPKSNFDVGFQKHFGQLKAFKEKHGNVDVPHGTLYSWMIKMRRLYADLQEGKPSPLQLEHITKLTGLGARMTLTKKGRKEHVKDYVDFVKRHGRFPAAHGKDLHESRLAEFASKMRFARRLHSQGITKTRGIGKTEIPQELIEALDTVDFRWKAREVKRSNKPWEQFPWEVRFAMLKAYKEKHGHCDPPRRHPRLGMFCRHQREQYKNMVEGRHSVMSVDRFRKLSEIGFRFKTRDPKLARLRYVDGDSSGYDTEDEKPASEENKPGEDTPPDPRLKEIETNLSSETEEEVVDRDFFEGTYAGGGDVVQFPDQTVATPVGVRFYAGKSPRCRHLNDMTP